MILKIAVCDDEKEQVNLLTNYLHQYEMEREIDFIVSGFPSSLLLLEAYNKPNTFHIIFLDVEMPDMNGLELAAKIRALPDKNVQIVFFSNYPQYMQSSFNVHAYHYIQKPIDYKELEQLMNRLVADYNESNIFKLLVRTDGSELLVNIRDILYVEAPKNFRNKLYYHLVDKKIETNGIMSEMEKTLSEHSFALASRGYLVNLFHIRTFKPSSILLDNGVEIPISRRCKKEIYSKFSKNIIAFLD